MNEYERLNAQSEAIKAKQGLRWIIIADEGTPSEDGYYLATVGAAGIDPTETTCHELNWFKGKWYLPNDEMIEMGPVIAWRFKPAPFILGATHLETDALSRMANEHHEHQQCDLCDQQSMLEAGLRRKIKELQTAGGTELFTNHDDEPERCIHGEYTTRCPLHGGRP